MTLYLPPLIRVSLHLRHALAESGVTLLYGWTQRGPVQRAKFGRAEYWMASKDFNGAVREYMRYFHADQGDPRPLLEAAHLLERQGNFQQSADMLREVIRYFQDDTVLWARTAFQLARMLEQQLNDPKAAYKLYAQIVKQAPKTEAAQLAAARIMDPDRVE
jgi:tetratricopeptide (TPR) repeat protein